MTRDPGHPLRGEIWYVNLDPVIGSEQGGQRPVLVVQNDVSNKHSSVVIVAAITSQMPSRKYSHDVHLQPGESGLDRLSRVMLNQLRTIDKQRLRRFVGRLTPEEMEQVEDAIIVSLGLDPL